MNSLFKLIGVVFLIFGITYSCKDPEPPRAKIKVVDGGGSPLRDVRVILFCPAEGCIVADTQYTNVAGESNHQIDLPAVLRIDAYLEVLEKTVVGTFPNLDTIVTGDTICGEGFITLNEGEVAEETIVMGRCEN